jgi:hypothetical protein
LKFWQNWLWSEKPALEDVLVRRHSGGGIARPREAVAVVRDCGPLRQGKAG